jgi:hypothetical protein
MGGGGGGRGGGEKSQRTTHVNHSKVCVDSERIAALVHGWQDHVWRVSLKDGEEEKSATGGTTQQTRTKSKI